MKKKILIGILVFVLIAAGGFLIYVNDYYHADAEVLELIENDPSVQKISCGYAVVPETYTCGLIFYPGAKVEPTAYLPLMKACADHGILSVAVQMPFNFAFFNINAAESVLSLYSDVQEWYLAGHSLGGVAAGMYAGGNSSRLDGVIFLASYTTSDISDTGLKALSIYGSEDKVLNLEAYEKYKKNLPTDLEERVIEGGNHAGFGKYGAQKGDGEAKISSDEQIAETADLIAGFTAEN